MFACSPCVHVGYCGFIPQSKEMHVGLIGLLEAFKLSIDVNVAVCL